MYARELRIVFGPRVQPVDEPLVHIRSAQHVVHVLRERLADEPVEVFVALCLAGNNALIGLHEVSRGCVTHTLVSPGEVFKAALLTNAARVILGHNHPSGDPAPSPDDVAVTRRLEQVGRLIDIEVLDHVIVGHHGQYYSFREHRG